MLEETFQVNVISAMFFFWKQKLETATISDILYFISLRKFYFCQGRVRKCLKLMFVGTMHTNSGLCALSDNRSISPQPLMGY